MHRFWDGIVEPLFKIVHPGVIVEIGSDKGGNTRNLLEYAQREGAVVHMIDPAPGYDVAPWQQRYGEHLVFYQNLSLDILPSLKKFDAVLIDGDHNYYTVFNELRTIEERCRERSGSFPLVLLHDVGWPYGRRDLYYNPENIPDEHRKPYAQKGMLPGTRELVEEGGLNSYLNNAVCDDEPQGGVLTAIEDFLGETEYQLELVKVPGINGLGIIFGSELRGQNAEFARFLQSLDLPPLAVRHVEHVEADRIEVMIYQQRESERLREVRKRLREESRALQTERQSRRKADQDVAKLTRWIESLEGGISAFFKSPQGKVYKGLEGLNPRILFKPGILTLSDRLNETLRQFDAWRRESRHLNRKN